MLRTLAAPAFVAMMAMAGSASAQRPDPVAARDLPRGAVIAAADVVGDSTSDGSPAAMTGWVTRRLVHKGEPLRAPAVSPPQLVRAGAIITVRAEVDGVVATRRGTALAGGALGEQVRVRIDNQRTVTGVVSGPETIRIP